MKTAKRVLCAALGAVQLAGSMAFGATASAAEAAKPDTNTIAAGTNHSLVIKSDMSLWAAGSNSMGQLGIGNDFTDSDGRKVLSNIIFAEANDDVSFAIDTNGTLYGWGDNSKGQISPDSGDLKIFKPMKLMENVVSVSAGETHTVAVTTDGTAYGWGGNSSGELGFAVNAKKNPVMKLKENIVDTAAGDGFTFLVTNDGKLYASGNNDDGQLGLSSRMDVSYFTEVPVSGVKEADAGNDHALLLMDNGTVMASGLNSSGQAAGAKAFCNKFTTVAVSNATAIFAGGNSSAVAATGAKLYVWGSNSNGQLHNTQTKDLYTPVSSVSSAISIAFGDNHSLVLKTTGAVNAIGENTNGQLFAYSDSVVPKPERIMRDVKVYSAGVNHAAAVTEDGNLYTWGSNDCGQLGLGDYTNRTKPEKVKLSDVTNVWCGDRCTIAVTEDGTVYVFGDNKNYKLGTGIEKDNYNSPKVNYYLSEYIIDDIQFGDGFCIMLSTGSLYGWGKNTSYQLGEWGKLNDTPKLIFEDITDITDIAVGNNHCLALTKTGELLGWGSNSFDQLSSEIDEKSVPVPVTIELADEKTYESAVSISASGNSSMAIDGSDKLWVWGANDNGQLGVSEKRLDVPTRTNNTAVFVDAGNYNSAIIDNNDNVIVSGSNRFGALGTSNMQDQVLFVHTAGNSAKAVSIGDYFGGYVRDDGALYCWGDNSLGQIGNGKGGVSLTPETVMSNALCKPLEGAKSIELDKTELIVKPNSTATLKATLTPENTALKTVRWSSSNTKVATVSTTGVVKGIKNGTAVITAETANGVSASCNVTVTVPVSSFSVSPKTSKTLKIGGTFTFKTKIYPSNAIDKTLIYESSDPDVATVSEKGKVKAISAGKTTITVTAKSNSEKTRTVTVYVKPSKMKFSSRKATADGVVLKWNENEAVDGYAIYRRTSKDGKEKLLANVEDASTFIDDTAKKGKTYYYTIKAYVDADGKKIYSASSAVYKVKAK